jgi:hypothetical protein
MFFQRLKKERHLVMAKRNPDITKLAKLLEDTNKKSSVFAADPNTFGKCEWTDLDGNPRCNSPWSEAQCDQVAGVFTLGESCPPEPD